MQRNMIAYKYAKALYSSLNTDLFQEACEFYRLLSTAFYSERFSEIMNSPFVAKHKKLSFLKSIVDMKIDDKVLRLLDLLVHNGRVMIIPSVYSELKRLLELDKNTYMAILYSKDPIKDDMLSDIRTLLSHKLGIALDIKQEVDINIDGIKIEILDLNIEVSFYKSVFLKKLRDSIFKAL